MGKKVRLVDVARAARVSVATVSRAARGSSRVSPDIADRIRRAAQELGADLYGRKKSKVIAFLLNNRNRLHPFHSHVLIRSESHIAARGWNMLFLTFRYSSNTPWRDLYLPQILERRDSVGGVILGGIDSQNLLELLKYKDIPFAVLGNNVIGDWRSEEHDVVWFDDVQGAFEMTQHLQSLGHRDIWHVGNTRLPWFSRRYEGYVRAMEEAGLPPRLSAVDSDNEVDMGYLAAKAILAQGQAATAIFAGGDRAATGVYKALRDSKVRVPDDVSVAGFNDIEAASLHPPLTTVRVFTEQVGKHLAELVLKRIESPALPPQKSMIHTQLVKRESCQRPIETMGATTRPAARETTLTQRP